MTPRSQPGWKTLRAGLADSMHHPHDHRPARARHPDLLALDAAIQLAAVLVLQIEPLEFVQERGYRGELTVAHN